MQLRNITPKKQNSIVRILGENHRAGARKRNRERAAVKETNPNGQNDADAPLRLTSILIPHPFLVYSMFKLQPPVLLDEFPCSLTAWENLVRAAILVHKKTPFFTEKVASSATCVTLSLKKFTVFTLFKMEIVIPLLKRYSFAKITVKKWSKDPN